MAEGKIIRRGVGVNVNDATATENDVLQGKTFYSGDKDIKTGNIPSKGSETFTPSTSNQTIASGQYLSGTQTILGDPDLIPNNIRDGVNIFGVTGTLVPPSFYLSFDGVDDYIQSNQPYTKNWNLNDFTVYFKFDYFDITGGDQALISWDLRFSGSSSLRSGFRIYISTDDNKLVFNKANANLAISSTTISSGTNEVYVHWTDNSGEIKMKINGITETIPYNGSTSFEADATPIRTNTSDGNNAVTLGSRYVPSAPNQYVSFFSSKLYDFEWFSGDEVAGNGTKIMDFDFNGQGNLEDNLQNVVFTLSGATWQQ